MAIGAVVARFLARSAMALYNRRQQELACLMTREPVLSPLSTGSSGL
jgi:hypothetical protein